MTYKLQDLIDLKLFQSLQDRLNEIYSFPSSIVDNESNILTATAWQDICLHFHRKNKECKLECIKSDQYIRDHLHEANPTVSYRCPHGLVDNVTPIIIAGVHYGNFFTGQFFMEKPDLDFFRAQAHKYGFNENAYIEAVKKVPIWTQEQFDNYLFLIKGLIAVISESGLKRLEEIESRNKIEKGERRYRSVLKTAIDGFIVTDSKGKIIGVNDAYCELSGYSESELLTMHLSDLEAAEDPQQITLHIQRMALQGGDHFGSRHRRKDGSIVDVEISTQFIDDEGGRFFSFVRDITARKGAEAALHESSAMVKSVLRAAPVGIGVVVDRVFQSVNNRFCEMIGYSREELIGQSARILYPDDGEYETVGRRKYEQIGKKGTGSVDTKFKRKNGEIIDVVLSSTPLDPEDLTVGVTFTALDITERKKAESALIKSERKWRNILENIPQIGITLDTEARIIFANEYFLKLTGWKEQEVIGQDWFDLFIPEHVREKVRNVFLTVMDQKDTFGFSTYENEIMDRSGDIINVAWSNVVTKGANGNFIDVTCLGVDLTERLRSEKRLKKSEAKYRTMMEAIKDPIYICSESYRIQYLNQAMIDRVGHDSVGEFCYTALHGFSEKCPWCDYQTTIDEEHSDKNITSPIDNREFNVSSSTFANEDGSLSKISVFRDTTEIKALQSQLQHAQKMESIGTLAGGIAHDFNNILTSIIGFTEIALDATENDSITSDSLKEIYAAGDRAKELVKQILVFARKSKEEIKPVQPGLIIREVAKFLRSSIPSTIELKVNIDSDSMIMANPTQMHQVVMNICTNAAQAMEDKGGMLDISLRDLTLSRTANFKKLKLKQGKYIELKISDTGTGIPQDYIDSIFDPYFTTKAVGEGTGLGLALVHGIVETYGGGVTVDSVSGKGATFTIYLPITKNNHARHEYIAEIVPTGVETVLFVDDEIPITKMNRQVLEGLGYKVTAVNSGFEALELFRDSPADFDLVITDMTMPKMTGDILALELMNIRPDIPVILCTGYSKKMTNEIAIDIGIKAFIIKPINKADLAKTIRKVLDGNGS